MDNEFRDKYIEILNLIVATLKRKIDESDYTGLRYELDELSGRYISESIREGYDLEFRDGEDVDSAIEENSPKLYKTIRVSYTKQEETPATNTQRRAFNAGTISISLIPSINTVSIYVRYRHTWLSVQGAENLYLKKGIIDIYKALKAREEAEKPKREYRAFLDEVTEVFPNIIDDFILSGGQSED